MIKFLGLLSKKKKINSLKTANLLVATLDEVIVNGFVEIQDFINNNNNLERNPNLKNEDIRWFRLIVFVGNLKMIPTYFEDELARFCPYYYLFINYYSSCMHPLLFYLINTMYQELVL